MTDPERVVELKEGSDPVILTAFNRPIGYIVPAADYQALLTFTAAQPAPASVEDDSQLVRLDAHAWRLAKEQAAFYKRDVGKLVSDLVRSSPTKPADAT